MPSDRMLAALLAGCALATIAASRDEASVREIAPGVYAELTNAEAGFVTVRVVRISPRKAKGATTPDLGPMLEAAFDWCTGRVPNGFQTRERGQSTDHGCRIALDAGVYRIDKTAVLRPRIAPMPMTIDLGSAVIVHTPTPPPTITVSELRSKPCDPERLGEYVNVSNPESFDDFLTADPEGSVEIASIGPNASVSPGCPSGMTTCKYGANAVRIRTRRPHGMTDGGFLALGDVAVLAVPGTKYDGLRLLVKEVLDEHAFMVTTNFRPQETASSGTVRETSTTAWCNGHRWRAGKPMIALGGPDSARKARITLEGGKFVVDRVLYRTSAVLIDGDKGPSGKGGAEWFTVDTTHGGDGTLRGQIVVDLGTDDPKQNLCQHITVRVDSNSWGPAWGPSVWNRSCATSDITVRQGHGGGVWVGIDSPGFSGPTPVTLRGSLHGCYDGPCLWVKSGLVVLADGMKIQGSMWGPYGREGPARGLTAILGTKRGSRVNVIAHGAVWGAAQDSDLDCYVRLGDVASFVQVGGQVTTGNAKQGYGRESFFCDTPPSKVDIFVLDYVHRRGWGGDPEIVQLSPPNRRRTGR